MQSLSQEGLEDQLFKRIKELEKTVAGLRSNQNQVQEIRIQILPQHENRWTQSDSYVDVVGAIRKINFDKYTRFKLRLEMVGYTDTGTGYWKLVNVTDGVDLVGSEISTISTGSDLVESSVITKPTGIKTIKLQHKQIGGAGFVNSVMGNLLFSFD